MSCPIWKDYAVLLKGALALLIAIYASGPVSAQTYEVENGTVLTTDLDCAELGADTIVINGKLSFHSTNGGQQPVFLRCPNVHFRIGAEISFDSDFHMRVSNVLSGRARLVGLRLAPVRANDAHRYFASASNGRNGRSGAYGGNGASCVQALFTKAPRTGEDGEDGYPGSAGRVGRSGENGEHGRSGPRVSVVVAGVSEDAELLINVTGSDGGGGGNGADGQNGGNGGYGGNGGDGGNGGYCQRSTPGGDGGQAGAAGRGGTGGRGGNGGDGGSGGQVLVVLSKDAAQLDTLTVINNGGVGGPSGIGGRAGLPGSPGVGGSPGKGGGQFQRKLFFPAAHDGMYGAAGSHAPSASDGRTGQKGRNGSWGSAFTRLVSPPDFATILVMSVSSDEFLGLYELDFSSWR